MRRHDRRARMIDETCAIRITVKANAQIRFVRRHGLRQPFVEIRQQRIRNAPRETSVRRVFHEHRLQAKFLQQLGDWSEGHSADTIACHHDDFQSAAQRFPFIEACQTKHKLRKLFSDRKFRNWIQ